MALRTVIGGCAATGAELHPASVRTTRMGDADLPRVARGSSSFTLRTATAATLAAGGCIHAQLYIDGYRFIHVIGPLFLLQASASFALAALLLIRTPPPLLRISEAGVALGALGGFTASRTPRCPTARQYTHPEPIHHPYTTH
ncbi:hypothetical protein ABZ770_31830 [Streptomyces sp. NPDC006654]|uniref:hypothetical protein n=1 Tax=Streptomyces sp. NPDC006654 TaxID=3156897 RepID=UPI003400EAFB